MRIESQGRRILLTGARAPVTLELARMFARAGHTVFAADSIACHGCRFSRAVEQSFLVAPPRQQPEQFIRDLLTVIRRERIELLIPTCEEIFYIAQARDELAAHCQVLAEPLDRLEQLHDKYRFIQMVQSFGLPVPRTVLCRSQAELSDALRAWQPADQAVVVKPVFSRFGARIAIVTDGKNPLAANEISPDVPWLAQAYVSGTELSTYTLAQEGKVLAHTTYQGSFRAGIGASIAFAHRDGPQIESWVEEVVGRLGFSGQIAFDLIEAEDGTLYPLECNPRATSGIHLLAGSPDFAPCFFRQPSVPVCPMDARAMLSAAMWLYGLPAAISERRMGEWLRTMRTSRDVLFRWDDPLPLLAQGLTLLSFWKRSRHHDASLLAATTLDIEWNGDVR
ncbi:ATP-grasp domain-containing protein [Brevibacillus fluminis]|uniref:ATP-grasp domain-containing protein n=1 Tax=Brevibacillus fluminis TaxID=511487 RepID=UPI003F8CE813